MSSIFFFCSFAPNTFGMAARELLRACVASTNPVKVGAVQLALAACFPDRTVEVEGRDVPSGVADQPMGDEETKRGAMNRLRRRGPCMPPRCILSRLEDRVSVLWQSPTKLKIAPRQRQFLC